MASNPPTSLIRYATRIPRTTSNQMRPVLHRSPLSAPSAPTATSVAARRLFRTCSSSGFKASPGPVRKPDESDSSRKPEAGSYSRTSPEVTVSYPTDDELRPARPVSLGPDGDKPTLSSFSLDGRVGIVTGGARGLGLVMAQGMVYSGMDVAIVDLNKEEAENQAKYLVEAFKRENPKAKRVPRVTAHHADVSDEDSVNACINEVVESHGKVDSLVTSAGFTENFDAVNYPIDRMRKLWGVNVDGTYLFAIGVARHLMKRKAPGSIVFIGSMSGAIVNVPQPQAPYNAAKAAVRHLAASLAVEWAGDGIRVNSISPGYMLTALTQKILDDNPSLINKWISLIPVGKMGVPSDLMGPVTFLLSDASLYVTGADLRVDGAYTVT